MSENGGWCRIRAVTTLEKEGEEGLLGETELGGLNWKPAPGMETWPPRSGNKTELILECIFQGHILGAFPKRLPTDISSMSLPYYIPSSGPPSHLPTMGNSFYGSPFGRIGALVGGGTIQAMNMEVGRIIGKGRPGAHMELLLLLSEPRGVYEVLVFDSMKMADAIEASWEDIERNSSVAIRAVSLNIQERLVIRRAAMLVAMKEWELPNPPGGRVIRQSTMAMIGYVDPPNQDDIMGSIRFLVLAWEGEDFQPSMVIALPNVEIRRRIIEKKGGLPWLLSAGESDRNRLYRILDKDGDDQLLFGGSLGGSRFSRVLWLKDPSTARRYILNVPPTSETVKQAKAWGFGLNESEYAPRENT